MALLGNQWNLVQEDRNLVKNLIEFRDRTDTQGHILEQTILLFNEKPLKGIQYGVQNGLLDEKPFSKAQFLLRTKGLNKFQVGEFLSEPA
jgi:Sec7-like guanine-nucleotide exchange factor